MALIAQAGQRRVDDSAPRFSGRILRRGGVESFDLQAQILRVVFFRPTDSPEIFRTGFRGQDAINRWYRAVVEVGGARPHADQRRRYVAGWIFIALLATLAEPGLLVIIAKFLG